MNNDQFLRKIGLFLYDGDRAIDLSELHIKFSVKNADEETPNNCAIRIYNVSDETIRRIKGEFSQINLSAGYEHGNYGSIFNGTIMQFKIGRETPTDTYLDIFASDGDVGYNQGIVNTSLAKGSNSSIKEQLKVLQKSINDKNKLSKEGEPIGELRIDPQHDVSESLRGVTMFGMGRARMRNVASTLDSSWSIQNGALTIVPNSGYLPGQAVKINAATGLVGIPEQTNGGIEIRCLLNSRIRIGGLVQLNNKEINQTQQQGDNVVAYNSYSTISNASLAEDGVYMAFVVEHEGDTRGQQWYTTITCLSVDLTTNPDLSVDPR